MLLCADYCELVSSPHRYQGIETLFSLFVCAGILGYISDVLV
eukprot:SAG31_NODE_4081_length_3608_cov_3.369336_6_plen_42_part_00